MRNFSKEFFHYTHVHFVCKWVLNSRERYETDLFSLFIEKQVTFVTFQDCPS